VLDQSVSYSNQVLPATSSYSHAAKSTNSYRMPMPVPPPSPYGSHFQDSQLASNVEFNWTSSFNGSDYNKVASLPDQWFCEMCNIELPNSATWQAVSYMQCL